MCANVQMRGQKYLPVKPTGPPFIPPTLRQYSGSLFCLEVSQIITRGWGRLTSGGGPLLGIRDSEKTILFGCVSVTL